jgi:calcium permeable stress-gated cation channel
MFMITRESLYYINLRQAYLLSPLYASRISSRTVLFASVPDDYLNEAKWHQMFGNKLKNLWIATDCKEIAEKVEERDKVAMKLEGAETKLVKLANATRLKAIQQGAHDEEASGMDHAVEDDMDGESGSVAARWIKPKQRPTHRTKFLIGKKVDTINWSRSELERLIPEVDALQAKHKASDAKYVSSVFVEFYSQSEAQAAYQMVAHHQPLHMAPRFIGLNPSQIVWANLRIKWHERVIRNFACIAFVCALILFWSIPVGFVGILSNINALTNKVHFLKFINDIPKVILGVVTGLLPSILMAVLMALLPIILRRKPFPTP